MGSETAVMGDAIRVGGIAGVRHEPYIGPGTADVTRVGGRVMHEDLERRVWSQVVTSDRCGFGPLRLTARQMSATSYMLGRREAADGGHGAGGRRGGKGGEGGAKRRKDGRGRRHTQRRRGKK